MRIRSLTVPAVLATGVLLLSGCGSDRPLEGRSGAEVADMAADALEEAGSVRVSGEITTDGEAGELDLWLSGEDVEGTLTIEGSEVEVISVGGELYMKAAPGFWGQFGMPGEVASQLDDQWIRVPGEAGSQFVSLSLPSVVDGLRPSDGEEAEARQDERDGDAVVVVERDDATLVVADDDPAYPLEMSRTGDAEGTLTFRDHGEGRTISAPEDAQDIDSLVAG